MGSDILTKILFGVPSILIAFVVHEICHGYSAFLFGDPTAKYEGRFSIDPRKHIDPIGAGVLIFTLLFSPFVIGWAKPVKVNPYNFKSPRQHMAWVAFAGPLSNFTMAAIAGIPIKFGMISSGILFQFLMVFVMVNIGLGLFNLIPIPPLDGSKILYGILPSKQAYDLMEMERQYATYIPLVLAAVIFLMPGWIIAIPYGFLMRLFLGQGLF
ncbi:MAG: site-2 protease family protein [Vulcanimicrobiota bacterium]